MLLDTLKKLYSRDLNKLKEEISLYKNEAVIWQIDKEIANSTGNLCLHLIGNLNAYIGAEFGKTGYIRNRPEEFSLKNIPRTELIARIEETINVIDTSLSLLAEDELDMEYPQEVLGGKLTTGYFLVHLAMH